MKGLLNITSAIRAEAVQILYARFNSAKAVVNRFTVYRVPESLSSVVGMILSQLWSGWIRIYCRAKEGFKHNMDELITAFDKETQDLILDH